jgi:hypothetical protein
VPQPQSHQATLLSPFGTVGAVRRKTVFPSYAVENNDISPARMWRTEKPHAAVLVGDAGRSSCDGRLRRHRVPGVPGGVSDVHQAGGGMVAVEQASTPLAPTNCDRQRHIEYASVEQRPICWR